MKLAFLGNGDFGVPTLRALLSSDHSLEALVTRPDRPSGRGRAPRPTPTKELALSAGLPVIEIDDLREKGVPQRLSQAEVDLWVVVAFPIIPAPLLLIPPLGTVNLHASLLPKYRGAAPVQRAIMAGEERTGVTTFFIDAGVDTGAICVQQEVDIEPGETSGELSARLSHIGADLMMETLELVRSGSAPREPQDEALAGPAPRLTKEEGRLVWSEDARTLVNRIRGTNPWPGAFTFAEGERLLVHRADRIAAGEVPWAGGVEPGTVAAFADDGSPIVAAGDGGGVVLLELQRGGRKASSGADVSRGLRWRGGEQLRDD